MNRRLARTLGFLVMLPLLVLLITEAYRLGMALLEQEPRDFWQALAWAAETLTTTGYGHDSQWDHPAMILFVVATQFIGLFLVFLVFPIFIIPFFEARFEERIPHGIPTRLHDTVLIYRYGPAVYSLLQDMARLDMEALILEEDEALARRLRSRGAKVVLMDLEDEPILGCGLLGARALILNGEDHDNAVLVLSARQVGYEGPIYAFVENPLHCRAIELAGATAAFSPKHAIAGALAAKASDRISPRVGGLQQLGERLEVAELRIHAASPLAEGSIGDAHIRERTGATIVGQWIGGEFTTVVGPETVLRTGAIVVVVGSEESIGRLGRLATPLNRPGPFLIAGHGEVGERIVELLSEVGEQTVVIDREPAEGVDLVADALDGEALIRAGVKTARGVILALSSDSTNLFAASLIRDIAPDVPIVARVNQTEDVSRIRAAGADFALSIAQVAGQLLERRLFGEEFVALEPQIRVIKVGAAGLVGVDPSSRRIRERTGCSVVAIERGDELYADLDRGLAIHEDDIVYLVGTGEATTRYFEQNPGSHRPRPG
jgi:Trk K+ transport system NAD-binding subunit